MAGKQAHLFALFDGEDDLSVGELDKGAPLRGLGDGFGINLIHLETWSFNKG